MFQVCMSALLAETCAELSLGTHTAAELATRDGVTRQAIYQRRRRAELAAGITLPRPRRLGRRHIRIVPVSQIGLDVSRL